MILPLSKNGVEPYYSKTCESCFKQASNNVSVSSICFHECGKFNSSHGQLAQTQGVSMVYCSGRKSKIRLFVLKREQERLETEDPYVEVSGPVSAFPSKT